MFMTHPCNGNTIDAVTDIFLYMCECVCVCVNS